MADLRPITDDAVVVPVVEESVLLVELGDGVRLLGVDLLLDAEVRPVLAAGIAPSTLETLLLGFGAVISKPLAEQLGVEVGDNLTVSANGRPGTLEVAAIFDAGELSAVWERVVLVDVAAAQELLDRVGRLDRIELVPRVDVDLGRLRARAIELLPPDVSVAEPSERRRFAEQMLASLRFNLVALSAISVLVGGVLVATTLATSVVQRRFVVSLLRSMGASRARVAAVVLGEATAIGLVGGVIGVFVGFVGRAVRVGKRAVHRGLGGAGHSCVRDPFRTLARPRRRGAGGGHRPGGVGSAAGSRWPRHRRCRVCAPRCPGA